MDGLELDVPVGSIFAFLGPNGAGKTTTIRAVLGLIRPSSGEVHLFGEPLASRRTMLLRRVGSLVETPSLYPHLTAVENLEVKRRLIGGNRGDVEHVLEIVGLREEADRLVREYSLGMQQRLGLAKAMLGSQSCSSSTNQPMGSTPLASSAMVSCCSRAHPPNSTAERAIG